VTVGSTPFLIVDLEATCDQTGLPRSQREVIEIGAVLVDGADLSVMQEFQVFVRPVRHPTLTAYCLELTTITQAQVDDAPGFADAMAHFVEALVDGRETRFCSWGQYDRKQLQQDCDYHGVNYPLGTHLDLSARFRQAQGINRRVGLKDALAMAGLPQVGVQHRGIDDARSLARLLPWCLGLNKVSEASNP
jgi:inhibitor of KinA sporulation pathway (predicted exonuclease)